MVELRVAHVYLAVLTLKAEIMRATAVCPSMAATTTVPTVPNTVALFDGVTGLATPRTLDQMSIPQY